jgi:hypothetical protein
MKALRALLTPILLAGALCAQQDLQNIQAAPWFSTFKETSLSASAEVITVHVAASSAQRRRVYLDSASVYCSVVCTITLEQAGTAPTTTALAAVSLNQNTNLTPVAAAFSASNVGTGTTITKHDVQAATILALDLKGIILPFVGATSNFTIRTSSITWTARITIKWREGGL